jgi:hypothetical protein
VPGVLGAVAWEQIDADGHVTDSGVNHNLFLDMGRSAYAAWLRRETDVIAGFNCEYLWLGTGTAAPQPSDTALQAFVTAILMTATAQIGGFTARRRTVLGPTQMTGVISEVLIARESAHPTTAYAKALLGITHFSGQTLQIDWYFAMQA